MFSHMYFYLPFYYPIHLNYFIKRFSFVIICTTEFQHNFDISRSLLLFVLFFFMFIFPLCFLPNVIYLYTLKSNTYMFCNVSSCLHSILHFCECILFPNLQSYSRLSTISYFDVHLFPVTYFVMFLLKLFLLLLSTNICIFYNF